MPVTYTDQSLMPIGKEHKGKKLIDVPADYLIWAYEQKWFDKKSPLGKYIEDNTDVLIIQAKVAKARDKFLNK